MPILFPRARTATIEVERQPVADVTCPSCGSDEIQRYPTLRIVGWRLVTRCQACLTILDEQEPETPLGFRYIPYTSGLRSP